MSGQSNEANKPVETVRHRNLKASIWRNQTEKGPIFNVTITRSYRQGNEWHDSTSFSYDDLMNVAKLMYDAHSVITGIRAREAHEQRERPAQHALPAPAGKTQPVPQQPRQAARRSSSPEPKGTTA